MMSKAQVSDATTVAPSSSPRTRGLKPWGSRAAEAPTTFDGQWDATLFCPPHNEDDDAKGYTHRFPAEIRNGFIKGVYGTEGQPGWHTLSGPIAPDGSAMLKLDGSRWLGEVQIHGSRAGQQHGPTAAPLDRKAMRWLARALQL